MLNLYHYCYCFCYSLKISLKVHSKTHQTHMSRSKQLYNKDVQQGATTRSYNKGLQQGALMSTWNLSTQISPKDNTPPQIFESGRLKQPRCSIPRIFRLQSSETYVAAFFAKMGILNISLVDARSFGWTYTQHTESQQHKSRGIVQGKCCNKKTGPGAKLDMGWLQRVGSLKLQVSSAEYCLFYRTLLQNRPTILRSLPKKYSI